MGRTKMEKFKHLAFDKIINRINDSLLPSHNELFLPIEKDQTTVHIIGAPRSGTTLLTQLLITYLDLGYISNLTATFYKAPIYGIRLSKQLLGENYSSNFQSKYGRTSHIAEPHEFSYFWKMHLNYSDFLQRTYDVNHKVNWENLKEVLYQMVLAYQKPIIFKSFQYGFHATKAVEKMPKTIFLCIQRDLYQNAYSLLKLRQKQFKDEDVWASIKPVQYELLKNENKYRQVIGQVLLLNYEYAKQLLDVPEENKCFIEYSELCNNPKEQLEIFEKKISFHTPIAPIMNTIQSIEEKIDTIPESILEKFKKAEKWVRSSFIEL